MVHAFLRKDALMEVVQSCVTIADLDRLGWCRCTEGWGAEVMEHISLQTEVSTKEVPSPDPYSNRSFVVDNGCGPEVDITLLDEAHMLGNYPKLNTSSHGC